MTDPGFDDTSSAEPGGDVLDTPYEEVQPDGTTLVSSDTDGDGLVDEVDHLDAQGQLLEVGLDTDADGTLDIVADAENVSQLDDAGNVIDVDALDQTESIAVDPAAEPVEGDEFAGDPYAKANYWFEQSENGWCGPASISQIVAEYTGTADLKATEAMVVQTAIDNGWLTQSADGKFDGWSGMTTENMTLLLTELGIPSHEQQGDMATLEGYLAEGREIIVSVDAHEIWTQQTGDGTEAFVDDDGTDYGQDLNHAVTVAGIDTTRGLVLLNDPGSPDGMLEVVPIEQFEDAWRDSNHDMVVTDATGPGVPAADTAQLDPNQVVQQTPIQTDPVNPVSEPGLAPVDTTAASEPADDSAAAPSTVPFPATPDQSSTSGDEPVLPFATITPVVSSTSDVFDLDRGAVLLPLVFTGPVAAAGGALGAILNQRRQGKADTGEQTEPR